LISSLLLGLAALSVVPSWALVPAALLLGAGAIAWNAVGMLAVMDFSPRRIVGKSTGLVLAGFLTGIATGAPVMGWSVDTLGSYAPGFLVIAGLLGVDAIIGLRIPESGNVAVS
jgi:MFS family permease